MPNELKNIVVNWISLVKAGANKRKFIYKTADDSPPTVERTVPIAKYDEEEGIVYGVVYSPGDVDTQGDFASAPEIKKAAYAFLAGLKAQNVDKQHSFEKEQADVVESWILEKGDPRFPDEKAGAWAVGIKVLDDVLKAEIKAGKIEGLSMAGFADKVVSKATTFSDIRELDGLWDLTGALERSIRAAIEDESVGDKSAAISENIEQFKAEILSRFNLKKSAGAGSFFRRIFTKTKDKGADDMKDDEVKKLVDDAIAKAIGSMPRPISKEDMTAGFTTVVAEALKPILARIEKIEKASPGSAQASASDGGDDKTDFAAIGAAIAKAVNG